MRFQDCHKPYKCGCVGKAVENRNPHALLVGVQIGPATMEDSMEVPPKVKNIPYDSAIALMDIYPKITKTLIQGDTCIPMFVAK